MQSKLQNVLSILVLCTLICVFLFFVSEQKKLVQKNTQEKMMNEILYERALNNLEKYGKQLQKETVDWNCLIRAIMWEESRFYARAVGKDNDIGVLQITPIYVAEVNRILQKKVYVLSDRYDSLKSVTMFNIMQAYYNPGRDIHLALKLHNPKAPLRYHLEIVKKYEELVRQNR